MKIFLVFLAAGSLEYSPPVKKYMEVRNCPETEMINRTKEPWNSTDSTAQKRAVYVCATKPAYVGNRCLKKFIKVEPRSYHALCGPMEDL